MCFFFFLNQGGICKGNNNKKFKFVLKFKKKMYKN